MSPFKNENQFKLPHVMIQKIKWDNTHQMQSLMQNKAQMNCSLLDYKLLVEAFGLFFSLLYPKTKTVFVT